MEKFRLTGEGKITVVSELGKSHYIKVQKASELEIRSDLPFIEVTQYLENNSYIPHQSYLFVAVDEINQPLRECPDIKLIKTVADFYFHSVLGTELFVKSVPEESSFYAVERELYDCHQPFIC